MSDLHIAGSDLRFDLTILRDGAVPGALDPLLSAVLYYTAPDGTSGNWIADLDDGEAGTVHHDVAAVDNADAGRWTVWAKAEFSAGGTLVTGAATVMIYPAGTVSPA